MRALWSGRLRFRPFDFPAKIYAATQSEEFSLNQLHAPCGAKIKYEKRCPEHGPVPEEEIIKGYAYDQGKYVTVTEADLEALAPREQRELEILQFVEPEALDPLMFDTPYYLAPDGRLAAEAYLTLQAALRQTGKYGIGRMVMRRRQYLVALWSRDKAIVVSTLRYASEVKGTDTLEELNGGARSSRQEIRKTTALIARHTRRFRHHTFKDGFQEQMLALLKHKVREQQAADKANGEVPPAEAAPLSAVIPARARRGMAKAAAPRRQSRKTGTR